MSEKFLLDEATINRSMTRISYEIIEQYKTVEDLVLVGIKTRGVHIAKRLQKKIESIENQPVLLGEIDITLYRDDRHEPDSTVDPIINGTNIPFSLNGKNVVLVDDVIFTGRTVRSALNALMEYGRPKTISLAVLIDRGHRELPIRPDYVGKNIPTSKKEEILVKLHEVDDEECVTLKKAWIVKSSATNANLSYIPNLTSYLQCILIQNKQIY